MLNLVSNTGEISHAVQIAQLVERADEVIFVSPFLFQDFSPWLDGLDLQNLKRFTLITTIAPKGDDQLKKPASLLSFYEGINQRWPSLDVIIQLDNKLHGKVYLFKKNGVFSDGIISSANLTHSGLGRNHEWGVHTQDNRFLAALYDEINLAVEYPNISLDLLRKLDLFSDHHKRQQPDKIEYPDIDAALLKALANAPKSKDFEEALDLDRVKKIFLKPWGTKEHPVLKESQRSFGDQQGVLEFPKGKPKDVGKGDLVITFGTGSRCILSIYKVLSNPEERPAELQERDENARRWPWFVFGHNYTTTFGDSWWEHDVTIDEMRDEFLNSHSGGKITDAGSESLGALLFGAGRLSLTKEFGQFIVKKIMSIEQVSAD